MRLSFLTVLVPVVVGFVIPDPMTAYQLVLDLAKDTQIGDNRQESAEVVNRLTKAFEEAAEVSGEKNKVSQTPWEAFTTGKWAQSSVEDNDNGWLEDVKKGREDGDHRGDHDHHGDHHHHHHDHHHHGGHHHHHGHHESSHRRQTLHDILHHHGFYNDHDKHPHSQPHGDHGHDGLSGHHSYHSIPKPHHDGHYHSNSTLWDLVNSCPETSIFASFAKKDTMFYNLLRDSHQNVTVFVPSNHAFRKFFRYGIIPEHGIDKDFLSKILNYHSAIGTHVRDDLIHHNTIISRLQEDHLGKGMHQRLRLGLDQVHGPSVNFFADILLTDVLAKNGVIHGISGVLLPPPSTADILEFLPTEFSTTTGALYRTGLIDDLPSLSGHGLTVFAPSNRDWEKLGWRASAFLFSDKGKEYLKALLKYHIVPGQTLYSDALDRPEHKKQDQDNVGGENFEDDPAGLPPGYTHLQLPTLLKGEQLSVDITRYERFLSFRVNGYNEIIISDGIARDGVVQVPNHVLIPPCRRHGGSMKEEEEEVLLQSQEKVWKAQDEGVDVDVEDLKRILDSYVERAADGRRREEEL
ncbi:Fasciclin domain-containing protein [Tirmania nivea]|nr:Fasciclin domain-containing protein [Tirmania nivea]